MFWLNKFFIWTIEKGRTPSNWQESTAVSISRKNGGTCGMFKLSSNSFVILQHEMHSWHHRLNYRELNRICQELSHCWCNTRGAVTQGGTQWEASLSVHCIQGSRVSIWHPHRVFVGIHKGRPLATLLPLLWALSCGASNVQRHTHCFLISLYKSWPRVTFSKVKWSSHATRLNLNKRNTDFNETDNTILSVSNLSRNKRSKYFGSMLSANGKPRCESVSLISVTWI